jgi:hypothetical protein
MAVGEYVGAMLLSYFIVEPEGAVNAGFFGIYGPPAATLEAVEWPDAQPFANFGAVGQAKPFFYIEVARFVLQVTAADACEFVRYDGGGTTFAKNAVRYDGRGTVYEGVGA